uniref:Endonuclease/exonuclease/phosphatase domain-containing protein n=1 Tax=Quercus lobata TaxID=97700 RepID=A0A7N2N4Z5_QUELO
MEPEFHHEDQQSREEEAEPDRSVKKFKDSSGARPFSQPHSQLSYRDSLIRDIPRAYAQAFSFVGGEDLDVESDSKLEDLIEGMVEVKLSKETKSRIRAPWSKAFIVKVFNRIVGYNYLTFKINVLCFNSVAMWVSLLELPIEFYDNSVLLEIGKAIRLVLRINSYIASGLRGSYARLCLQINLTKPLINTIKDGCLHQKKVVAREESVSYKPAGQMEIRKGLLGTSKNPLGSGSDDRSNQVEGLENKKAKASRSPREKKLLATKGVKDLKRSCPNSGIKQTHSLPLSLLESSFLQAHRAPWPNPNSTYPLSVGLTGVGNNTNPWWKFITNMPLISEKDAEELNRLRRPLVVPHLDEFGWLVQERKVIDFKRIVSMHLGNFPIMKLFQTFNPGKTCDLLISCREEIQGILNYMVLWKPNRVASKELLRRLGWSMIASSMVGPNPMEISNNHCAQMNILLWNCRGALNMDFKRRVMEMAVNHFPSIMVLTEIRVGGDRAAKIVEALHFNGFFATKVIGYAEGLWLLWKKEEVDVYVLSSTEQEIHAIVKANLSQVAQLHNLPWLLLGDFNEVLCSDDKLGGRHVNLNRALDFKACLDSCDLLDLGFSGPKFTWSNLRQVSDLILECIDRCFTNPSWRVNFPEAAVTHLPRVFLYHCPVLLELSKPLQGNWNWEAISSKLPREIKDKMCASPMQLWDDKEDTLKWKFTRDEEFSTASAYALLRPEEANPQIFLGNWIWKLDIWPKIISSLWLCHHDSVPVK